MEAHLVDVNFHAQFKVLLTHLLKSRVISHDSIHVTHRHSRLYTHYTLQVLEAGESPHRLK